MTLQTSWSPASANDTPSIARLLRDTNFVYRSPGISDTAKLFLESESLLGWRGPVLQSALVAGGEDWPVADLQLSAAADSAALVELAHQALPRLEARVLARDGRWLRILNGPAWLVRQLIPRYKQVDVVVFYQTNCSSTIYLPELNNGFRAQCASDTDLFDIKQVDEGSFIPFWQASAFTLGRWLQNAKYALALSTGKQIVAFILARLQGDTGNVYRLAVLPEWQGRGLGRWLMTRIITDMQAHGAATITLNTQACNQRARSLYERMGFTLTGHEVSAWARDLTLR